jgi:hypothetical protein
VQFQGVPGADDYLNRIEVERGSFIRLTEPFSVLFDYAFYVLLAMFVFFYIRRRDLPTSNLFLSFIIPMFLVWNVQVITGFVPHPDHFEKAISPIILLMLLDGAMRLTAKLPRRTVLLVAGALMMLLVSKKVINATYFIDSPPQFTAEAGLQSYRFNVSLLEAWEWMNEHLPGEPVVVSDSLITSTYLLGYTRARPYLMTGFNT